MTDQAAVAAHYGTTDLTARVAEVLDQAFGPDPIPWQALAPLDQFHVGGLAATMAHAAALAIAPGTRVLDIGSGLGGPARCLAATTGCDVTGIDLSTPFTDLATMLTARTGLSARARFQQADATALPFPDAAFDLVWTQHVAMNIADRAALYAGIARVLRPDGRLALYDAISGAGEPLFPVPWARTAATSFLRDEAETRAILHAAGLRIALWEDVTAQAMAWQQAQLAAEPPKLPGLALIMGADFPALAQNFGRNLREGRVRLLHAVLERPT